MLTADGRVARALSSLALNPRDLRLALVEAGEGRIGGLADRITLLCSGFDPVHGVYTPADPAHPHDRRRADRLRARGGPRSGCIAAPAPQPEGGG